jgi:hypothetical protein
MTRRCTRFGSELAAFAEDTEQDRLLEGRGALIWLDDRFLLAPALPRSSLGAPDATLLRRIGRSGR